MPTLEQARIWYLHADPVHDFSHVQRVYRTAEKLARLEGADLEIVRAAALLHDVEGTTPGAEERANHHHSSAEFAAEVLAGEGWPQDRIAAVQHCIRAHRFRDRSEPPGTIEAKVLFDADKLDVIGAIGVARAIAYATLAGTPVFNEPSKLFLTTGEKEPGELHSAYHEFVFKLSHIRERLLTTSGRLLAEQRHQFIVTFFEQLASEERGER
jgi:uncharacterized protein